MPRARLIKPRRPWPIVVAAAALSVALAACGSQLSPDEVAGSSGEVTTNTGAVVTDPGSGAVTDPGTGTVTDPGTGAVVDPGTGAVADPGSGATSAPPSGPGAKPGKGGGPSEAPDGAPSCDGLQNSTGITDTTITIGNSSDISGPVPGLFEAAQDATKAFVAYFNASQDICGRKLVLKPYDSRTDAGADQAAYAAGCDQVFAMVGSASAFDSGGAKTAQDCGLPDVRVAATTQDRLNCTTCYSAQSTNSEQFENAVPDFILRNYGDAGQHAAMLYTNAGAAAENGKSQPVFMTKRGMHFAYVQGIDVSEFNYAPYVQAMKDKGVQTVQFIAAGDLFIRLINAMKQQNFKPKLLLLDPTAYTPEYVQNGGDAAEGTVIFMNFTPFEEAAKNPELQLYLSWLQQVKPGATPTFFGAFAWSAARLFTEQAQQLGGELTRASLVNALSKVDNWTDHDLHSRQHVGSKTVGECWRFIQLQHGVWRPIDGTNYHCDGVTSR